MRGATLLLVAPVASFSVLRVPSRRLSVATRAVLDDDEDDDDYIDTEALGDWRDFRRTLVPSGSSVKICEENEQVLASQSPELAAEYRTGVWAHETPTVRCR